MAPEARRFRSPEELSAALSAESYLADHGLAVALYLAAELERPLLLEGEPGVGKTEVARSLARVLGAKLVRLQCYEGIDAAQALYDWDYARQLLYARVLQAGDVQAEDALDQLYDERFLRERPLLEAVRSGSRAVLLVDELDRADDEFEAFLLETLSDFAVTIPELGTVASADGSRPLVILTSNRTRELHDALKRRCLYHWIDYPDEEREVEIIRLRVPGADEQLARSVAHAVSWLRDLGLVKPPGAAEAIDWAAALAALGEPRVGGRAARETLGFAVKNREDLGLAAARLGELE
jgi:MoxR-like ATPase